MTPSRHILYLGEAMDPVRAFRECSDAEFTVCLAASPEDALARLEEFDFDCVVYAGDLPAAEGVLDAVAEHSPTVPAVVHAGTGDDPDLPTALYDRVVDDEAAIPPAVTDVVAETRPSPASKPDGTEHSYRHAPLWEDPSLMETVLDNLLDVFFVFTVDRELVEWNTRLEETTGCTGEELLGSDPLEFIAPEHREEALESLGSVLTEGRATGEFDIVSTDGEHTPCEFVASLITQAGAPRYICGIGRDITDLRRKQAELERKQEKLNAVVDELERSNAELEQFAYVASHDMKEPLRMVRNYVRLLDRRYSDQLDEDAAEFIEYADDGARRLQAMIDQLLTYSRIDREGDPFREIDCGSVLDTVQRNLEVTIEESGAEIDTDTLPTVTGDRNQLIQLFQNLLSNAIKYNEGTPHVHITATCRGDTYEFAVTDDGIGIPQDQIDRVFESFYGDATGVADADSTGIGLSICERIVERHGGDIWVESTPGEGTTFYFTLPTKDADQEPESPSLGEVTTTDGSTGEDRDER